APASCRFDGTPAVPAVTVRGGPPGHASAVGRGTRRDQREAVSVMTGLVPRHHPKVHPTPAGAPRRRRERQTTRPAREPSRTGPCLRAGEPAELRMATGPGTNEYRDRPGHASWHSRPRAAGGGAGGGRMWVGGGSSVAVGPGAAPAADDKPGRGGAAFATAAVHPGPRPKTPHRSREGEILSLDSESLMWVRRDRATTDP